MQSSEVLLHVSGNATNSLLKNSFGSSFRGALRHGISLFVGFWRGGILYSVRDGVIRSLFQQTANRRLRNSAPKPFRNPHVRYRMTRFFKEACMSRFSRARIGNLLIASIFAVSLFAQ